MVNMVCRSWIICCCWTRWSVVQRKLRLPTSRIEFSLVHARILPPTSSPLPSSHSRWLLQSFLPISVVFGAKQWTSGFDVFPWICQDEPLEAETHGRGWLWWPRCEQQGRALCRFCWIIFPGSPKHFLWRLQLLLWIWRHATSPTSSIVVRK